jgi:predicted transposase/invertase (TIGR01784 family)
MWPVFADPKTDFVFKRIFGAEDRKHLLIGLLNALLELDEAHRIVELHHLPVEQRIAISELKLSILDVKCTDATGTRYVVEMQLLHVEGFEKRVVYNVPRPMRCSSAGATIIRPSMTWSA